MLKKLTLTLLIASLAIVSCKKKTLTDEEISTQIIGSWQGNYATGEGVILERSGKNNRAEQTITFNEGGTYEITRGEEPYVSGKSYFIRNSTVYLQHIDEFWTIEKLTSKRLKFVDPKGNDLKYKKQ